MKNIIKQLREPFPVEALRWRIGRSGEKNGKPWAMILAYVDARDVRKRLNDVVGPENWTAEYHMEGNTLICDLSIRKEWYETMKNPASEAAWVTKSDGAGETKIEGEKGIVSKAFVRAAACFGIGEYLYRLKDIFATFDDMGIYWDKLGKWNPPHPDKLPSFCYPGINDKQLKAIQTKISNLDLDRDEIKKTLRIESMREIPGRDYENTIQWLDKQKKEG